MTEGDHERDRVGELIRAAGRRPAPSEEDRRQVLEAARRAWQAKLRSRRRRRGLAIAASVAAVAVLGVGIDVWLEQQTESWTASLVRWEGTVEVLPAEGGPWRRLGQGDMALAEGARVRTSAGARASLDLNGVSLRTDETTEVVLDSPLRIELVNGAVYVDSGPRTSSSGIEMATAFGELRNIGTQFEARSSRDTLRLRVREGRVLLTPIASPRDIESVAGDELTVTEGGDVRRRAFPSVHADWAWAESLAVTPALDGVSARSVLTWVARETGRRLVFDDAIAELRARDAILSGGGVELAPLEVLEVVIGTVDGLDYSLDDRVLAVRSR
jgi:ferric-dicitrate binding protein FerR (iron transport regulator)